MLRFDLLHDRYVLRAQHLGDLSKNSKPESAKWPARHHGLTLVLTTPMEGTDKQSES